jgi:predicted dehydrogenase
VNRRELLGGATAALVATGLASKRDAAFASNASGLFVAAPTPVRVGVIGPGSRGKELIRHLLHVPGVEIAAVADVYAPRFAEVNLLVGRSVPSTKDYRELLARPDLDAIVIASPIYFHSEHVLAALRSRRPVYGEKSMAFTTEQCQEILTEANRPGRLYQVGHEYRYAPWVQEAIRKAHSGAIGEPTHVYGYWHRNNSWRRPVPSPSLEHLMNWRLYRESSGGLVTELGSHQIDIANWVFGAQPTKTLGTTSIVKWNDGRTVGDNVQATFNYPGGRRLFFSALTDNAKVGNDLWIYGTEGSIQITIEDATIYYEPKTTPATKVSPEAIAQGILTGASYSTKGEMPYRGPGERLQAGATEDPTYTALHAFIDCVREKEQPQANAAVAFASGVASACANKAVNTEESQSIPLPV